MRRNRSTGMRGERCTQGVQPRRSDEQDGTEPTRLVKGVTASGW